MEKLDLQTPDFTAANIARLAELFPNCATETRLPDGTLKRAIDFDLLRQELSHDLVEGPQERYRLDWPGKREALALANAPIRKTLRPNREESVNFDATRNLYIEGDNLDALKLLQETYLGQVKMIYIDPPYNTGNDFIYDDDFSMSREEFAESSGEVDAAGNAMFDEEKWKQNSTSNGRFHSDWLSTLYPRLRLARNLLADDGLIFMSIDDGEVANLRKISDEVFGSENFVANVIWEKKYTRANDAVFFSDNHDHILCYCRDRTKTALNQLPRTDKQLIAYSNPDNHPKGRWKATPLHAKSGTNKSPYQFKNGILWAPPKGTFRRFNDSSMALMEDGDEIWFGRDGKQVPSRKSFLSEVKGGVTPVTIWPHSEVGHNHEANDQLKSLGLGGIFNNPKPFNLIQRQLILATTANSIILDFFSGSATTAHAVMQLNAEDGGKRRHIMVQLPEPCDEKSEAFKAGYATIAEIGKERIRRAGQKVLAEWQAKQAKTSSAEGDLLLPNNSEQTTNNPAPTAPDIGFRVLKVDSSNFTDVYFQPDELTQDDLALQVDNLKRGRKPEDLLFQVLLDWGVDLALPVTEEQIAGRRVFFVDGDALAACFETGLDEAFVKALAARAPLRAVFRDAGYASDAVKINIEQIFKALSPHTELKTL
jgi:adenine-specific DNA-methyltransferase